MFEIIIIIITLISIYYMLLPVFTKEILEVKKESSDIIELNRKIEVVESNISDLDFDYQMGKMSEDDYSSLKKDYEDDKNSISRELKKSKKGFPKHRKIICPECGKHNLVDNKFCANCGFKLTKNSRM